MESKPIATIVPSNDVTKYTFKCELCGWRHGPAVIPPMKCPRCKTKSVSVEKSHDADGSIFNYHTGKWEQLVCVDCEKTFTGTNYGHPDSPLCESCGKYIGPRY